MNPKNLAGVLFLALFVFCLSPHPVAFAAANEEEPEKGPHGGRILRDGDFALELSIFETGVPPEYRVWVTGDGKAVPPEEVDLTITLTRLGGVKDKIRFKPQADFLRGDTVIYEPHSFVVTAQASYQGKHHHWEYDNFEGRTAIAPEIAAAMDIRTEVAGPVTLVETLSALGRIVAPRGSRRDISARFQGLIKAVHVELGQAVKQGDRLFTVESNESLNPYTVRAPINGQVVALNAAAGEITGAGPLLTLLNAAALVAEVKVFPDDRHQLDIGNRVQLLTADEAVSVPGRVTYIAPELDSSQGSLVRIALEEATTLPAGTFVRAEIDVAEHDVPLAVKRTGLQSFRDFTVVYAKVGQQYEVRMLDLGREAGEWVEVLGGLKPDTEYVSHNSYIIKADIEKSGASHDH